MGFDTPERKKKPCVGKSKDCERDNHRRMACQAGRWLEGPVETFVYLGLMLEGR